jgi:hypothetical protein
MRWAFGKSGGPLRGHKTNLPRWLYKWEPRASGVFIIVAELSV